MMSQAKAPTPFKRIAAQSLHEDRGCCCGTFCGQRAGPFDVERASSGTGFAAVDHPLQLRREFAKSHRCELRLDAHAVHDGRNVEQSWHVTGDSGLVGGKDHPYVWISRAPVGWKHPGCDADALGQQNPIEMGRLSDQQPQALAKRLVDFVVEYIGHRGAEYPPSLSRGLRHPVPLERLTPVGVVEITARRM